MHIKGISEDYTYSVYKITNLATNEGFVGVCDTADIRKRISGHLSPSPKGGSVLLKIAVKIFGYENFTAAVIDYSNEYNDAIERQEKHIIRFKTFMPHGYNLTTSSKGSSGYKWNENQRKSIRGSAKKGTKLVEEDIFEIRTSKEKGTTLAKRYAVSPSLISRIRTGDVWTHVKENEKTSIVYKFTNQTNGKDYIGITSNINKRLSDHLRLKEEWSLLHKAVKKYGWNNFRFDILESGLTFLEAQKKEIHYIEKHDSFNNGYNSTPGGDGTKGRFGEDNSNNKITAEQAQAIINDPRNHKTVADEYGLHIVTVYDIRKGKIWKNLDRSQAPVYATGNKLTDDATAQKVIDDPCSNKEASTKYGVPEHTVHEIRSGRRFKHLNRDNAPKYKTNRLDKETRQRIFEDPRDAKEIANEYGIAFSTVYRIKKSLSR